MAGERLALPVVALTTVLLLSGSIASGASDPPPATTPDQTTQDEFSFGADESFVWNTTHAADALSMEIVVSSSSFCTFESTSSHFTEEYGPVQVFKVERAVRPGVDRLTGTTTGSAAYHPGAHVHVLGNADTRSFGEGDRRSFSFLAGLGGSGPLMPDALEDIVSPADILTLTVGLRHLEPYDAVGLGSYEVKIDCAGPFEITSLRAAPEAVLFHAASTEGGVGTNNRAASATALDRMTATMEGEETQLLVSVGEATGLLDVRAPDESYALALAPFAVEETRGPPGTYAVTLMAAGEGRALWGALLGLTPLSTLDEVFPDG